MCGRYYVDEDTAKEIRKVIRDLERKLALEAGDVHPSEQAVVLTGKCPRLTADRMQWGFPQRDRKGLLINARAESALERIMFRDSVRYRRCIIPAAHFYEWNKAKEKATFCREDSPVLYMAGIWNHFENGDRFVILTTQANVSVAPIHERMPLILEKNELENWVYEDGYAEYLLRKTPVLLKREQEYEQMTFL